MRNELFISLFGLVLALFLFIAGQMTGYAFILLGTVIFACYCAYFYNGARNVGYAAIPGVLFVVFIWSSYTDATLANIMMFVSFGSILFFAMNADREKPTITV